MAIDPVGGVPPHRHSNRRFDHLTRWWRSVRTVLSRPAIVSVLAVVLGFNVLVELEFVQANLPMIRRGQLAVHRFLCSLSSRSITPKWVRTVEIDNAAHLALGEPTDRTYLAKLVSNAARGEALAIVLDIKLIVPEGLQEDDGSRREQNEQLLAAIRRAAADGVPVVLATWLRLDAHGEFTRLPNIFRDDSLPLVDRDGVCRASARAAVDGVERASPRPPTCVWIGNLNLPIDRRRIPLVTLTRDREGTSPSPSLALAAASAFEAAIDRQPRTLSKSGVAEAVRRDEFPFGSFIPEQTFQKIPIAGLADGSQAALCRGRIIIVGGTWAADLGRGEPVDSYDTPVGRMRGMYLHANYVEALLDDRYSSEVPLVLALLFDFIIGLCLYVQFHHARRRRDQLKLLLIPPLLLVASYVMFANLNVYLDFILPLGACFVHLAVEYARDYVKLTGDPDAAVVRTG
jgi:CHASE2 domain-containing sensor protein